MTNWSNPLSYCQVRVASETLTRDRLAHINALLHVLDHFTVVAHTAEMVVFTQCDSTRKLLILHFRCATVYTHTAHHPSCGYHSVHSPHLCFLQLRRYPSRHCPTQADAESVGSPERLSCAPALAHKEHSPPPPPPPLGLSHARRRHHGSSAGISVRRGHTGMHSMIRCEVPQNLGVGPRRGTRSLHLAPSRRIVACDACVTITSRV